MQIRLRSTRPLLSILCFAGLAMALVVSPGLSLADGDGAPAAQASKKKKKKCGKGKVRRKGKCVKKKGSGAPAGTQPGSGPAGETGTTAPPAGPAIRPGSYTCFDAAGTINIHGNTYDVNNGPSYPYTYDPATNIVNFPDGDYKSFYGLWYGPDGKDIQIRANYTDEYTKPGDYLWTCSD
jgi:hypothetical protein